MLDELAGQQLSIEGAFDQRHRFRHAVKRNKSAKARPLRRAKQHFINRFKPVPQRFKPMGFPHGKNCALQGIRIGIPFPRAQFIREFGQRFPLLRRCRRLMFRWVVTLSIENKACDFSRGLFTPTDWEQEL